MTSNVSLLTIPSLGWHRCSLLHFHRVVDDFGQFIGYVMIFKIDWLLGEILHETLIAERLFAAGPAGVPRDQALS